MMPTRPPPARGVPFWATRDFRMLVIVAVMGLSVVAVLVFEIAPMMIHRKPVSIWGDSISDRSAPANLPPPVRRPELRFDGMLDKAVDGTPMDSQDEVYLTLLRHVARTDAAAIDKEAREVPYAWCTTYADVLRGECLEFISLYLDSYPVRVEGGPQGVEWVHRTHLTDMSGTEGYVVDFVAPPPKLSRRTPVRAQALFLRIASYEGTKGEVKAPHFIGRTIVPLSEHRYDPAAGLGNLMVLSVSALAVLLVVWLNFKLLRRAKSPSFYLRKPLPPGPNPTHPYPDPPAANPNPTPTNP